MTPEEIRKRHFANLNSYREIPGYADADTLGERAAILAAIVGKRWEIDEDLYDEFLNILPPLGWHGGVFYMREFTFDDITTKFSKEGNRYFCEFARYPGRAVV